MTPNSNRPTWIHCLAGFIGVAYLHLVAKTSIIETFDDPATLEYRRKIKSGIYAFWHNAQVYLCYDHRLEKVNVIVSQSKDGEYIAQVMKQFNLTPVRGSSSRGGGAALLEIVSALKRGARVGFTPDGPRGPVYTVAGGVVKAAMLSGAPIIPTHAVSRRRIEFRTWDKFVLPLPFSHIIVTQGKPFCLSADMDEEKAKEMVQIELNKNAMDGELKLTKAPPFLDSLIGAFLFGTYNVLSHVLLPLWIPILLYKFGLKRSLKGWSERLGFLKYMRPDGRVWWFHAASIGEWQALKPLIKEVTTMNSVSMVITVSTPEAEALIRNEYPNMAVSLLPVDLPFVLRRWVKRVNPDAMILVETELWPNLLRVLYKRHVPIFLVNGRLSNRSVRGWMHGKTFVRRMMVAISAFLVRTDEDAKGFQIVGAMKERIRVMGNMKNDNLTLTTLDEKKKIRLEKFGIDDGIYMAAGSTWGLEESVILKVLTTPCAKRVRLILAPRRPERFGEVASVIERSGHSWSRWSKIKNDRRWDTDVLLVDTLGDLGALYRAADVAFVGGTLEPRGGQNPLEPAAARLAIVFGPSMENFSHEAKNLLEHRAARQASDADDVVKNIMTLIQNESERSRMGEAAAQVVLRNQGVATRTLAALREMLEFKS